MERLRVEAGHRPCLAGKGHEPGQAFGRPGANGKDIFGALTWQMTPQDRLHNLRPALKPPMPFREVSVTLRELLLLDLWIRGFHEPVRWTFSSIPGSARNTSETVYSGRPLLSTKSLPRYSPMIPKT